MFSISINGKAEWTYATLADAKRNAADAIARGETDYVIVTDGAGETVAIVAGVRRVDAD